MRTKCPSRGESWYSGGRRGGGRDAGAYGLSPLGGPTTTIHIMEVAGRTALVLGTVVKLLLWPAYHSTDMEVHRNWLAITYSLPLREWYIDATSPWTLDYPPFFAYFSWVLAQPAAWLDPVIVDVKRGLEYAAWSCKAYMRFTVLATESVLGVALYLLVGQATEPGQQLMLYSVLLHPGLLMVDHIHFQYNGFLFGVLFLALWAAQTQRPLLCAWLFASLLQYKHLFIYIAPAFTIYLLRAYLFPTLPTSPAALSAALDRTIKLGTATLTPFALSLLPFVWDALGTSISPSQVLTAMWARLFPFDRGLMHAYWAPNVWALYAAFDRVLLRWQGRVLASTSRGMVGDTVFGVLPTVPPLTCFALALSCILVYLGPVWRTPNFTTLLGCVTLCAMTSFAVGWHVHEKAILMAVLPLSLLAHRSYAYWRTYQLLTAVSIVSLFPLLFTHFETPIKLIYAAVWYVIVVRGMSRRVLRPMPSNLGEIVHFAESAYLRGLVGLVVLTNIVVPLWQGLAPSTLSLAHRYAFLPLMLTSVYCALGFVYGWLRLSMLYLQE